MLKLRLKSNVMITKLSYAITSYIAYGIFNSQFTFRRQRKAVLKFLGHFGLDVFLYNLLFLICQVYLEK